MMESKPYQKLITELCHAAESAGWRQGMRDAATILLRGCASLDASESRLILDKEKAIQAAIGERKE